MAISNETVDQWKCFHCGEAFTDQRLAWEHFGDESTCASDVPGCIDPLRTDEKERLKELREAREYATKCQTDMQQQEDRMEILEGEISSLSTYFGEDCKSVWLAGDLHKSALNLIEVLQPDASLLAEARLALEAAEKLLDAMETCHICKDAIMLDESLVCCEDCSSDCDEDDFPNCVPIYALHQAARKSSKTALARLREREGVKP